MLSDDEDALDRQGTPSLSDDQLRLNFFIDTMGSGFRPQPDRLVHFVGNQKVSFGCAKDMAAVGAQALRHPEAHAGKTYPLAAEAPTSGDVVAIPSYRRA